MDRIQELAKFSKTQKDDLEHYILNALMKPEIARLLKRVKTVAKEVTLSKGEAKVILDTIFGIRKFVIGLPRESFKISKAQQILSLFDDEGTLASLGKIPSPALGVVKTKCSKVISKLKKKKKKREEENE